MKIKFIYKDKKNGSDCKCIVKMGKRSENELVKSLDKILKRVGDM